ncbi:B12-binding domain-containing radical SAM protein [Chloroflexota bacterium]
MKLELVAPASRQIIGTRKKALGPPLGLAIVAALTPPGVEISLTDENVTAVDFDKGADLVGITTTTLTAPRAYEIADTFRSRGVKVVLGGIHASVLPEEACQHADAVVCGEAEGVWPALIDDFRANRLKGIYYQNGRPTLDGMPPPRRDLFLKERYVFPNTVSTTRGCPNSCSFCSVTSFFGRPHRCRPVEQVLEEIDTLRGGTTIFFVDDDVAGNHKYAKELFSALIPYRIKWIGQASVTVARDEKLLGLLAASGCLGLLIGFESVSPASLATVGKKVNVVEEYAQAVKKVHAHGISIHGFFIFGFDHDDEGIFQTTLSFAQKVGLESAGFATLTPLPGTSLYQSLDEAGRIITKDWSQYYDEIVFAPRLMSPDALLKGRAWVSRKFFSLLSIWRRCGIRRRHMVWLWGMNLAWRAHHQQRWRGKGQG